MSDETKFMRDSIQSAIEEHLAQTGGGFLHSFVYALKATDSEGRSVMYLGGPLEQETVDSLGLTNYLDKWYDTDARQLIAQSTGCPGCSECGEDDE